MIYSGNEPATPEGGYLLRIRTKSGPYRRMSRTATPVTDESGDFVGGRCQSPARDTCPSSGLTLNPAAPPRIIASGRLVAGSFADTR